MSEEKSAITDKKLTVKQVGGVIGLVSLIPFYQYFDAKYVQQVQFKAATEKILKNEQGIKEVKGTIKEEIQDVRRQTAIEIEEIKDLISEGFAQNNNRLIRIEDLALDRNKSLERRIEKLEEKSK